MGQVKVHAIAAEVIGTFVFFLIGLMAVTSTHAFNATTGPDLVVIALGFGFGLFAAIAIGGAISGGHFNPAVTIAAIADRRLDPVHGVAYIAAQLVGGIAAAIVVGAIFDQATVANTITAPGAGVSEISALIIEILFTAIFVAVIFTAIRRAPNHAGFIIPLTLVVIHLAIVPFTGSSVNPARSIVSALIGGDLGSIWIYIVGPIVGGLIGWAIVKYFDTAPAD